MVVSIGAKRCPAPGVVDGTVTVVGEDEEPLVVDEVVEDVDTVVEDVDSVVVDDSFPDPVESEVDEVPVLDVVELVVDVDDTVVVSGRLVNQSPISF